MARAPANSASKKFLTENELVDGTTLSAERYVEVASIVGTKKKNYAHGYGNANRQNANAGFAHADFAATPDGGTTITSPKGKGRFIVYSSEDREIPKYIGDEFDLVDYREAAADARTDKPVTPINPVGAGEDEVLSWELKVDSAYDGEALSASNSDVHLPFSEFRRR